MTLKTFIENLNNSYYNIEDISNDLIIFNITEIFIKNIDIDIYRLYELLYINPVINKLYLSNCGINDITLI